MEVKDYLALRKKYAATTAKPSGESSGRVVEVRGKLSGVSKSGDRGCMIISTDQGGSFVIDSHDLPAENPGTLLACIVKEKPATSTEMGGMELLAWTYEVDLRRSEEEAASAAKPKPVQPRPSQPAQAAKKTDPRKTQPISSDQLIATYRNAIKGFNKKLSDSEADTIARSILGFSYKYKLDARLVCAVIIAESNFRIEATSHCGAMGLGQLMPGTAAGLGVSNAYDPVENVYGSVRYIRSMLDRMSGNKQWNELTWKDLSLALAAYNAGPGNVKKHGGVPPFRETQNYVKRVTAIYKKLCGISS